MTSGRGRAASVAHADAIKKLSDEALRSTYAWYKAMTIGMRYGTPGQDDHPWVKVYYALGRELQKRRAQQ